MNTAQPSKTLIRQGTVLLAYAAFIVLAMPNDLLGSAWRSIHTDFGIPLEWLERLVIASVSGYVISAFLSGALVARLGVGRLLALSCALTGAALLGYTLVSQWWMLLLLGMMAGLGAGAIAAGLNTYAAAHFREGLVQWLHASYALGVIIGLVIISAVLTNSDSWRVGYRIVAGFQVIMALAFVLTLPWWGKRHERAADDSSEKRLTDYKTPLVETILRPRVWLSVLLFFLYAGAEVSLGTWAYSLLTNSRDIAPNLAALAGGYWVIFVVVRILAGVFAHRLDINTLVQSGLALAFLGAGLLWWNPFPLASLLAVALINLAIAPIFPALISGTSRRVEARFAANTIGMQVAAAGLGGLVISRVVTALAVWVSPEVIPIVVALLFLALLGLYRLSMTGKVSNVTRHPQTSADLD